MNKTPPATHGLAIHTFGELSVTVDGAPIKTTTDRKRELLLVYLAHQGKPQSRRRLAQLLYPSGDENLARNNLRSLLNRMRREGLDAYLVADRSTLGLNLDAPIYYDAGDFRHLLTQRDALDPARLSDAMSHYQGSFLVGLMIDDLEELEEWILETQRYLEGLAIEGFQRLTESALDGGDQGQAETYARQLLEVAPYDDRAHELFMLTLARDNRRVEALRHYKAYLELLERELGISAPSPTLVALAEDLRRQTPAPAEREAAKPVSSPEPQTGVIRGTPFSGARAPLFGREAEKAQLRRWLVTERVRLVTIAGLGGIGKTHLALSLAESLRNHFPDGVWFVELADARNQDAKGELETPPDSLVAGAIGRTLGISLSADTSREAQLLEKLSGRKLCLILDNFEPFLSAAPFVKRLSALLPDLTLLITSRVQLNLPGEYVYRLQGLSLPATDAREDVFKSEAVRLYIRFARQHLPHFAATPETIPALAQITRKVEGHPLALLLIAAWMEHFELSELVEVLERGWELLSTTRAPVVQRHASIERILESSWCALSPRDQHLLADTSIFRGTFHRQAAKEIVDASLAELDSLCSHSMLTIVSPGRYRMHPLVHEFAAQKLEARQEKESPTQEQLAARHAAYYVRSFAQHMDSGASPDSQPLLEDYGDIQAALAWHVYHEPHVLVRLLDLLDAFWWRNGMISEANRWLNQMLERLTDGARDRALTLDKAAVYAQHQTDYARAEVLRQDAIDLWETIDDPLRLAESYERMGWLRSDLACGLQAVKPWFERSLAIYRELNDGPRMLRLLLGLFDNTIWQDLALAETYLEEAKGLAAETAIHPQQIYVRQLYIEIKQGRPSAIRLYYDLIKRGVEEAGELSQVSQGYSQCVLAFAALALGEAGTAESHARQALAIFQPIGHRGMVESFRWLAGALCAQHAWQASAVYYRQMLAMAHEMQWGLRVLDSLIGLGICRLEQGDARAACRFLAAAQTVMERLPADSLPHAPFELWMQLPELITRTQSKMDDTRFHALWAQSYGMEQEIISLTLMSHPDAQSIDSLRNDPFAVQALTGLHT